MYAAAGTPSKEATGHTSDKAIANWLGLSPSLSFSLSLTTKRCYSFIHWTFQPRIVDALLQVSSSVTSPLWRRLVSIQCVGRAAVSVSRRKAEISANIKTQFRTDEWNSLKLQNSTPMTTSYVLRWWNVFQDMFNGSVIILILVCRGSTHF